MKVKFRERGCKFNLFFAVGLVAVSLLNSWLLFTRSQVFQYDCAGDNKVVVLGSMEDAQKAAKGVLKLPDGAITPNCLQNPVLCWNTPLETDRNRARVLGQPKAEKVFLTIGIPTVSRNHANADYLSSTLHSLIDRLDKSEYKDILIVVFLADFNPKLRSQIRSKLQSEFKEHIEQTGLIHVVEAPRMFYPPLENLKSKFNDSSERVYWRSKQSADFAFLLTYCNSLSNYYLHLEDDVLATKSYFKLMKEFIVSQQPEWISISFSVLGFIGKLFREEDLDPMAKFILFFYNELPVDITYQYYLAMKGGSVLRFTPSLFQHVGDISSLKNKIQPLKDPDFVETFEPKEKCDNPPAKLFTSMDIFEAFTPEAAYSREQTFFWGRLPTAGDTISVVFDKEQLLTRISVSTGMQSRPHDIIVDGMVQACPAKSAAKKVANIKLTCPEHCFVTVGKFTDGKVDVKTEGALSSDPMKCLRIVILKDQDAWALVRDIAVWVQKR